MKLALLSYSHHGRGMGRTVRDLGHDIVGVFDLEEAPRQQLVEAFECPGFETAGACLDACQPDAAIVAGKHIEIHEHVTACVDRRIPYLLDKPFADCADRLRPVAEASEKAGVISALTLPNRTSRVVQIVSKAMTDGSFGDLVLYSSRLNNGPPDRYDPTPSYWHNDPSISGGGCWATESAHGIDTFLQFVGDNPITVVGAIVSNTQHKREVEDSGVGMLRTASGITGIVESGYSWPSGGGGRGGDHFFRFIGTRAQIFQLYDHDSKAHVEVHTAEGITVHEELSHGERMGDIIAQGLASIARGKPFSPSITQAVRILEIQDAVYNHARRNPVTNGPHPMGAPARPPPCPQ